MSKLTGIGVIVSMQDIGLLENHKWRIATKSGYPARSEYRKTGNRQLLMHRIILGAKPGQQIDHINGDKCDNRRGNLRIATCSENIQNRPGSRNASSQYKGVSWCKEKRKWAAYAQKNGKRVFLGRFDDEAEAAKAYDAKSSELYGRHAYQNLGEK